MGKGRRIGSEKEWGERMRGFEREEGLGRPGNKWGVTEEGSVCVGGVRSTMTSDHENVMMRSVILCVNLNFNLKKYHEKWKQTVNFPNLCLRANYS